MRLGCSQVGYKGNFFKKTQGKGCLELNLNAGRRPLIQLLIVFLS